MGLLASEDPELASFADDLESAWLEKYGNQVYLEPEEDDLFEPERMGMLSDRVLLELDAGEFDGLEVESHNEAHTFPAHSLESTKNDERRARSREKVEQGDRETFLVQIENARAILLQVLSEKPLLRTETRRRIDAWLAVTSEAARESAVEASIPDDIFAILAELESAGVPKWGDRKAVEESDITPYQWLRRYYAEYLSHFGAPVNRLFQFQLAKYDKQLLTALENFVKRQRPEGISKVSDIIKTRADYSALMEQRLPDSQLAATSRLAFAAAQRRARRRSRD